ncbi:MAG: hypothetical protein KDI06_04895, partial [Calditrichaeota bacterium]|nr:hypothetical protein [Calditrichota bacterium]
RPLKPGAGRPMFIEHPQRGKRVKILPSDRHGGPQRRMGRKQKKKSCHKKGFGLNFVSVFSSPTEKMLKKSH